MVVYRSRSTVCTTFNHSILLQMLCWLSNLRTILPTLSTFTTPVMVVMGNQACDLDSGISSITLAYHLSLVHPATPVIPLMNINTQDFPLKTELVSVLAEEGIHQGNLFFRDTFDLFTIQHLQLILVDHNVLTEEDQELSDNVVEIIDHHVRETDHKNTVIEPVGSCSSLVLRKILTENPSFDDKTSAKMIMKTILLDTVELQPSAKRVTPLDVEMVDMCEKVLGDQDRGEMFRKVLEEKCRVDHLTAGQLCRRDLKVVKKKEVKIALSSVPMLAKDWTDLANVEKEASQFMSDGGFTLLLVLGINIAEELVTRDLVIIGDKTSDTYKIMEEALKNHAEPNLGLEIDKSVRYFTRYGQKNNAASRKQILPIVKNAF